MASRRRGTMLKGLLTRRSTGSNMARTCFSSILISMTPSARWSSVLKLYPL